MCTSMNYQPYRVIVVREKAEREKFRECLVPGNAEATSTCQAYVIFLADVSIIHLRILL